MIDEPFFARLDDGLIGVDFAIEREEYDVAWGGSGHIDVDPCPDSGPVFALLHVYTAQDSFTLAIRPGPGGRSRKKSPKRSRWPGRSARPAPARPRRARGGRMDIHVPIDADGWAGRLQL